MPRAAKAVIQTVEPGSIAEELGLRPGDVVKQVNDQPVRDMLDWQFLTTAEDIKLQVERAEGGEDLIQLEKDFDMEMGLSFGEQSTFDGIYTCVNKCMFCFVHQMPRGMRRSLYLMDDDFRLSFMHGNFITLVGISEEKWNRILEQRLSPMYISVHATDDDLRARVMGTEKARGIMDQLRILGEHGIGVHTQVVAMPGINDGAALDQTIAELCSLENVLSIAVVPVGLTKHRQGLAQLDIYQRDTAVATLDQVDGWRDKFSEERGTNLVWCSDEMYVIAGREVPDAGSYEGYPQLENGLGVIRLFKDEFAEVAARLPGRLEQPRHVTVVTGTCAAETLQQAVDRLNQVENLQVDLLVCKNDFFGHTVTVAGLLTGQDIIAQCQAKGDLGDLVLIPGEALRDGDSKMLDEQTLPELEAALGTPVHSGLSALDLCQECTGLTLAKVKKGRASRHVSVAKAGGLADKLTGNTPKHRDVS